MLKYLLLLLVIVLVLWAMRPRPPRVPPRRQRELPAPEPMVRCSHCGMHLPRGEALLAQGQPYCSAAHRDAGPRGP